MRDIVLTAFVLGSLPFILRRPQLGIVMYVWLSVMNPHRLAWSFAQELNFAAIVALTTLAGAIFSKEVRPPPMNALTIAFIAFVGWTGVTTLFALHPEEALAQWQTLMKTFLMAFLIPMLLHKKEDLHLLVWTLALSIAYYGTKGGIWTLVTGSVARVYGPAGSYIEDNNAIAAAVVMVIPLLRYLHLASRQRYVRWALIAMMVSCAVAVLGTYSRGALLAVTAMGMFFWWKGRHKLQVLVIVILALPYVLATMPENWYARMETIRTYEVDSSASMRLNSWGTMWNLAKSRPVVGAGFDAGTEDVYARYSPDTSFPAQTAHSIYFQALGEHGFVGLALYLLMFGAFWRTARRVIEASRNQPELHWAGDLSRMMQVTLIGFLVGGAFLSLVNFDVPYYLVALMIALLALVERQVDMERSATVSKTTAALQASAET